MAICCLRQEGQEVFFFDSWCIFLCKRMKWFLKCIRPSIFWIIAIMVLFLLQLPFSFPPSFPNMYSKVGLKFCQRWQKSLLLRCRNQQRCRIHCSKHLLFANDKTGLVPKIMQTHAHEIWVNESGKMKSLLPIVRNKTISETKQKIY